MSAPEDEQPFPAGSPVPDSRPNPSVYSSRVLKYLYTPLIIGFSHRWVWGVPNSELRSLYRTNIGTPHVEIGPGNAHWLRKQSPRQVHLIDITRDPLRVSNARLEKRDWQVFAHQQSATDPWPLEDASVQSVGAGMILHCLPGENLFDKRPLLTQAHRGLKVDGRLFGATVLGEADPAPISRLGKRVRDTYNNSDNVFSNRGDTAEELHQVLESVFGTGRATVRVFGATALFQALR